MKASFAVLLPVLAALLSCSGGSGSGGSGAAPAKQELVVNNVTEVETLDPGRMQGVPEHRIAMALFEGLCVPDPRTNRAAPGVAERWDPGEDYRTWTFHLRREARWSDGKPVTAGDFVYAWLRVLDPNFPTQYAEIIYKYVEGAEEWRERIRAGEAADPGMVGIRVRDDYTLEVRLKASTPFFPDLTCHMTYFPVPRWVVERHGDDWTKPGNLVGNGPYVLKERRINRYTLLEKNPYYWNAQAVSIPRVRFLPVNDLITSLNMYERRQTDWITAIPLQRIDDLLPRKGKDVFIEPYLGTYYYQFNTTVPPLGDPKVRRALALAIDRETLCRQILRAGQQPAYHYVPPVFAAMDPPYRSPALLRFDPDEARRLLEQAGFPGGRGFPRLRVLYNTLEQHRTIAAYIQEQWRKHLGIEIELENTEWNTYLERRNRMDYQIARAGWIGDYIDPMTFLDMWITGGGHNNTGWSNAAYDERIFAALRESDRQRRRDLLQEAEQILMEELPIVPLYFYVSQNIVTPDIEGFFAEAPLDQHPLQRIRAASGAAVE